MLNLDDIVSNKKTAERSSSERNIWPCRLLIIGPSGSVIKLNLMLINIKCRN